MSKRYEQWGYESFKDNKTGEICDNYIDLLNQQAERIAELEEQLKKSLESNNDLLIQIMELQSQLISGRLKGEKK